MIFAVTDYIRYRRRRGRYSHDAMTKEGLHLATPGNFQGYRSYRLGDIFFASTSDSFISWLVMYFTQSVISHTALFYGNGIVHDCTTHGVVRHSFGDYLDGKSYITVRRAQNFSDENRQRMKMVLDATLGDRYAWDKVFWLFLLIICGAHHDFSWRFYADFALVMIMAWLLSRSIFPWLGTFVLAALALYSSVVLVNRIHGKWKTKRNRLE